MTFWIALWKWTFFVGVGAFAIMAVAVIVGGMKDIRRLFERIDSSHRGDGH